MSEAQGTAVPHSEPDIAKIAEALSKAQGAFPVIEKNSKVEVYSKPPNRQKLYEYYYADLTEIISKTRAALSSNGLSFTQGMVKDGFATTLMHSSGQRLVVGFIPCQIKANDYKEMAGAITYLKRISLSAALGVSADEDVDAAESEAKQGNSTQKTQAGKSQPKPATSGPRNYAPGAENPPPAKDELDAALGGPSDEESLREEAARHDLLETVKQLVERKSIKHNAMPEIIKKATGKSCRSTELTVVELTALVSYLQMK